MSDYATQVTLWHRLFVGCGAAALIFLVLAGILFFALKIPRVFRSLTGRARRKADRGEAGKTAALAGKDLPPEEWKRMAGEEGRAPGEKPEKMCRAEYGAEDGSAAGKEETR